MQTPFEYDNAFSRNIGWVTRAEQALLRSKRLAIAGMGGVGGIHLLTLARLGVSSFHIADFDTFEINNFNRQVGATLSNLGQAKTEVMSKMALDINPEMDLRQFPEGINQHNLPQFLDGVDLYVDGLDFFAFSSRQETFRACAQRKIPAITAAPLGIGAAVVNFIPGRMTFDEYFTWGDCSEQEKALRFLLGLAPMGLHFGYLVDPTSINFAEHKVPSTIMACQICAGVAATEALKILLKRGTVLAAPYSFQFDAYRNKVARVWRPGGNRNPLQLIALQIAKRRLAKLGRGE